MTINWGLIIILHLSAAGRMYASRIQPRTFRIVNGKSISIERAPWQASIQVDGNHVCGGTILTSSAIVTAAHCVTEYKVKQFRVRAGSTFWNYGGRIFRVRNITKHPKFNVLPYLNDIAILYLSKKIKFNRGVQSIPLAIRAPSKGAYVAVSGWGISEYGSVDRAPYLQYVKLKMISRHSCSTSGYAKKKKKIRRGMICAFGNKKDACQGDSGGPMVRNGKLVGIVSWGIGCAWKEFPGVYTDVAFYRKWILDELKKG